MYSFVSAYLIFWAVVLGYFLRLVARQRRLQQIVESLPFERLPSTNSAPRVYETAK